MASKKQTTIKENQHPAFEAGRNCKMSDYTKHELSDIEDRIRSATMGLLIRHEFFGIVALKLKRVMTDKIPTAATDGRSIMYNPAFVKNLSQAELTFLVAHEVYHCVFQHFLRRDKRNPMLWNLSGDYVINLLLCRDNIGKMIEGGCYDKKYAGYTTEQIYKELYDEAEKNGVANGDGSEGETIDVHIEPTDENGDPVSEAEAKEIGDNLRESVIQAAKAAGNLPGEIKRMVDDLLKPQINFRDLIEASIASKQKFDTTFMKTNRRSWGHPDGVIFPGDLPEQEINIAVAMDNSGSISNEVLREMLSEVKGIADTFKYKMKVWCFDTQVSGYTEYSSEEDNNVENYQFTGGGGTHIAANFDYIEKHEIDTDLLIVFTDLYCGSLSSIDPNIVDTVWILHQNDRIEDIPFGRGAVYHHNT